jgi:hypothetical protein
VHSAQFLWTRTGNWKCLTWKKPGLKHWLCPTGFNNNLFFLLALENSSCKSDKSHDVSWDVWQVLGT